MLSKHSNLCSLEIIQPTIRCGAVGKLSALISELSGTSMTGVRNPLEVFCGQEQAEPQARINPTI